MSLAPAIGGLLPVMTFVRGYISSVSVKATVSNSSRFAQVRPSSSGIPQEKKKSGKIENPTSPVANGNAEVIVVTVAGLSRASSSTKMRAPIIKALQTVSIVSRNETELRASASPSVADALSYTAGVQAEPSGIDSRVDEVSVRGFGGSDNLVTKRPTDKSEGELLLQGTGFANLDNWQGQASGDISGRYRKNRSLSGRMVALARHGDAQVKDVTLGRYYISPSISWQYGPHSTWALLAQYQCDQGGSTFQFLPDAGTLYPYKGQHTSNDANISEPDWDIFDRNQALIGSFLEHRFNRFLTLRNNTRYTYIDTLYPATVLSGDTLTKCSKGVLGCVSGETVARRAVEGRGRSQGAANDTQIEGRIRTSPVRHILLIGTDYFYTKWKHSRDVVSAPLVLPVLSFFDIQRRGSARYAKASSPQVYTGKISRQNGIYFQDQIKFERLHITLGGRQAWARDDTLNVLTHKRYLIQSGAFARRAGGVYLFVNGFAPYFSYARSFQPQVSDPSTSLNGTSFRPMTGEQYEAGLRYQYGNSIYITFGSYQITQTNMFTSDPGQKMCGTVTCLVQTGRGRVRGLELEGRATLPWDMAAIFWETRSDARVTESNTAGQIGNYLPRTPRCMAPLFVDQRIRHGFLRGVGAGGGVRYTGRSYGDTANRLSILGYALFDMFLRYDVTDAYPQYKRLSSSLNMRNITNKRFVATCTAVSACYYGQGRSLTGRLEYR